METIREQQVNTKVRRPRAARACELCRAKKNKCDELLPCTYCRNRNAECIYQNSDRTRRVNYSTDYVRQLERQVKALSSRDAPSSKLGIRSHSLLQDVFPSQFQVDSPHSNENTLSAMDLGETLSPLQEGSKAKEVTGVNRHTKNIEFYGSSSSMALLSRVRENEHSRIPQDPDDEEGESSLVSQLHNPAFFPSPSESDNQLQVPLNNTISFFQQCRGYLNDFFGSIHYIHPILDKANFVARCEEIWSGNLSLQSRSFLALYYSLLSLGALVGSRDEDSIDGLGNLDWSRKFFDKARTLCGELSMTTDLEMVQCFFFMAKICQNELNPHLSYMYTGFAVRTALAIGINREPLANNKKSFALLKAESRTWWGLYSLETEMSFAMGRPDTLGVDLYHNRQFPLIVDDAPSSIQNVDMTEPRECAIIKCMVDFSRITRTVCLGMYLSASPPQCNLHLASRIEKDLDSWLDDLPVAIRPSRTFENSRTLKSIKDAQYIKKQRLVLSIRYHNVKMLLFASFLTGAPSVERSSDPMFKENIAKCLDSAKQTVDIIYETYSRHDFFRTWYYNTTYTLFAVSILLVYIVQEASPTEKPSLFSYVEMSIEILETMDDCVVAKKAAKMIARALSRAKANPTTTSSSTVAATHQNVGGNVGNGEEEGGMMFDMSRTFNHYWGPVNLMDGELDVNFPFELGDLQDVEGLYGDFVM